MQLHPRRPTTPHRPRSGERVSPEALSPNSRRRRFTEPSFSDWEKFRHDNDNLMDAISGIRLQIERISNELTKSGPSKRSRGRLHIFEPHIHFPSQDSVERIVGSELDRSTYRENFSARKTRPITPRMSQHAVYTDTSYGDADNLTSSRDVGQDWIEPLQSPYIRRLSKSNVQGMYQDQSRGYDDMLVYTGAYDDELIHFCTYRNENEEPSGKVFPERGNNHDGSNVNAQKLRDTAVLEIHRNDEAYDVGGVLESSDYSDQYVDGLVTPHEKVGSSSSRRSQEPSSIDSLERGIGQDIKEQEEKYEEYVEQESFDDNQYDIRGTGKRVESIGSTFSPDEPYASNKTMFANAREN